MYAYLDAFVTSKTAAGLSLRTVEWYADFVRQYAAWSGRCDAPIEKPETVEGYLAHLRREGRSAFTISGCYRALSVYFKWLVARRYLVESPLELVPPPRTPIKRTAHITAAQFKRLYESIDGDHWWDVRDRAILLTLFYCGLRANELLGLRLEDVDRERLLLLVNGKGGKARDVPCTAEVIAAIDSYLSIRPAYPGQRLILASDRDRSHAHPMAYDGLKEMMRRRCRHAGLPHYSAHKFRHGYAMALLNAQMPLSALTASMGHSSVQVTEKFYARWQTQSLSDVYNQAIKKLSGDD